MNNDMTPEQLRDQLADEYGAVLRERGMSKGHVTQRVRWFRRAICPFPTLYAMIEDAKRWTPKGGK